MEDTPAERAARYRERAEEIRASARSFSDARTRDGLLRLVAIYERLAKKLEGEPDGPDRQ